jgi:4-diphosphocytidyl-2-C-methyl-D-erythritol kinase
MQWKSPAKINWTLRILGKRPDGFHELETLMLPISVADTITVTLEGSGVQLTCSNPDLPCDASNLAWRAAEAFQTRFGALPGVRLHIDKVIPVGAGLGGGSSNAATVLLALRALTDPTIPDAALAEICSELGSDVPFFIYQKAALCKGRGEIIEPIPWTTPVTGLLVHPGFGVSTPWSYKTYAANPRPGVPGKTIGGHTLQNDLEPPAFSKHLWLPTAKAWFQSQPEVDDAMMSGSGSSIFAVLRSGESAQTLKEKFGHEFGESLFAQPFELLIRV